jgi:outer membrane protein assembly factor BamB
MVRAIARVFISAAACVVGQASMHAGDWPEFRGPTGQGHAVGSDPPVEWNAHKNVAWRTSIAGSGWSSPIVWDDRIYVTTAVQQRDGAAANPLGPDVSNNEPVGNNSTAAKLSLRVIALDAETGEIIWEREIVSYGAGQYPPGHAKNGFASPTPVTDGDRIYVHFGPLGTAALTKEGKILWLNTDIKYDARHGGASSPVIVADTLVVNCDGVENPSSSLLIAGPARSCGEPLASRWIQRDSPFRRPW